jgi:uncharacterized protein YdhG (YjbR/CyaY superfamily)
MSAGATTVDAYLAAAPVARFGALREWRRLCRSILQGFDESIRYGMPSYSRDGTVEVAFANQSQYLSLYVLRTDVLEQFQTELEGVNHGKGVLRFADPDGWDPALISSLLEATVTSHGPVC